jgi:MFS family permease
VLTTIAALWLGARLEGDPHGLHDDIPQSDAPQSSHARTSVLWRIKTSCFGTFAYGYFQATAVVLLPLYLMEKGIPKEKTLFITAFFALGMLLCSNAVGKLGDRIGHLRVMRGCAIVGLSMVLAFVFFDQFALMCVAFFVTGATLASMSAVSLALQGHVALRTEYHRANAFYNAFYAAGMLVGPPLSSAIYEKLGGTTMIVHLVGLWGAFVIFTAIFWKDDPAARRRARAMQSATTAAE